MSAPLLLRSALYLPCSNARALAKAAAGGLPFLPDALILDLEDAVAPASKSSARTSLVSWLAAARAAAVAPAVVVRVNRATTPWGGADLAAVGAAAAAGHGPHAVLLPKVEGAAELLEARAALSAAGGEALALWAMVETPRGVLRCGDIAAEGVGAGLACLVAGTADLTAELRGCHTRARGPLLHALSTIVLAARAEGMAALDGVHLGLPGGGEEGERVAREAAGDRGGLS